MTARERLNRARPLLPYGLTIGMLLIAGAFIRDTRADSAIALQRADSAHLRMDRRAVMIDTMARRIERMDENVRALLIVRCEEKREPLICDRVR